MTDIYEDNSKATNEKYKAICEALPGEDFIILLRGPDGDGTNTGVLMMTNAGREQAIKVITTFADVLKMKVAN